MAWKDKGINYSDMKRQIRLITGFVPERWANGYIARIPYESYDLVVTDLKKRFELKSIGIGYDYNSNAYSLLVIPKQGV